MSKGLWGADTTDERKPTWPWVSEYIGYANCFATGGGWTVRWPWGDEVIVALSNLTTKLGNASILTTGLALLNPTTGYFVNAATREAELAVMFNEAITVTGTPTLQLITTGVGEANVVLSYNSTASVLTAGKLVFSNGDFSLGTGNFASSNLVVNSSSIVAGWDGIKDAGNANVVANGIPAAVSTAFVVYQQKPIHTATLRVGTANNSVNGQIGFALKFNEAVVLGGNTVPITMLAIGNANAVDGNVSLSLNVTASNTSLGNLVFQSAVIDFSNVNAAIYTINSTSTLAGWSGIRNAIGGVVTNSVIVANTFTIAVS